MLFLQRESRGDVNQTWLTEEESLGRGWRYMASSSQAGLMLRRVEKTRVNPKLCPKKWLKSLTSGTAEKKRTVLVPMGKEATCRGLLKRALSLVGLEKEAVREWKEFPSLTYSQGNGVGRVSTTTLVGFWAMCWALQVSKVLSKGWRRGHAAGKGTMGTAKVCPQALLLLLPPFSLLCEININQLLLVKKL